MKAGTYKVKTTAKYKSYVSKSSTTKTKKLVVWADDWVQSNCKIMSASGPDETASDFDVLCTGNFDGSFTSTVYGYLSSSSSSSYRWRVGGSYVDGGPTAESLIGQTFSGMVQTPVDLFRTADTVKNTKSYSAVKTKTKSQTLRIKQGKKPRSTRPSSAWNCPSWAPIKGNASSGIYHVKSGAFYTRTKPEICFSSESAARKAGYRKSKR